MPEGRKGGAPSREQQKSPEKDVALEVNQELVQKRLDRALEDGNIQDVLGCATLAREHGIKLKVDDNEAISSYVNWTFERYKAVAKNYVESLGAAGIEVDVNEKKLLEVIKHSLDEDHKGYSDASYEHHDIYSIHNAEAFIELARMTGVEVPQEMKEKLERLKAERDEEIKERYGSFESTGDLSKDLAAYADLRGGFYGDGVKFDLEGNENFAPKDPELVLEKLIDDEKNGINTNPNHPEYQARNETVTRILKAFEDKK